jgi:predicted O-linked N-acetylglucosamine transferase (SPINDLY family)
MTQPYHLLPRIGSSLAEEWLDVGLNHHVAGRFAEAEQAYLKGLRVQPDCGPIIANMGVMAAQQNKMLDAIRDLERALLFDENNATTWYNYALALLEAERSDEALPAIKRSIKIMESADSLSAQGMILTSLGKAAEAVESYDRALEKDPKHPMASYNAIFCRTLKHTTPEDNHIARKRWYEHHRYTGVKKPHDNDRTPDRRLRIGYLGGDFKMHSAAFIFSTVIFNHDKEHFDPYCFMSMPSEPDKDSYTKLFMERTTWRDISAKTDDEAEAMIRADKIDILVDLSGHTGGNRLPLLTRKPAPVQCHGWGFAHGSGLPEVDYFLADRYSIPVEERQYFAEKIWDTTSIIGYLPAEYQQPGISPPPVTRDGTFTFGVFGRFEKYSPPALEAWHKILLRTPNSRLLVKDLAMRRPYVIRHIREVMHDIDPKRLMFVQATSHPEHMLSYQQVDLVLDTFPHTGGVTALEILYMGVPVVTLYNGQVGGRTTSVALKTIGRVSWVASSIDEYVRKAVKLAEERTELANARKQLREEMQKSPMWSHTYPKQIENAYRRMWWRHCGHDTADSGHSSIASGRAGAQVQGVGRVSHGQA